MNLLCYNLHVKDASEIVSAKRDAAMLTVPVYLGEDLSQLHHCSQANSCDLAYKYLVILFSTSVKWFKSLATL